MGIEFLLTIGAGVASPLFDDDRLVEFLDRNGDGVVEPYEGAEAFLLLAEEADRDADGAVSSEEIADYLDGLAREVEAELDEWFGFEDRNGDGVLRGRELPPGLGPILMRYDADADGAIDREEFGRVPVDSPTLFLEWELGGLFAELDEDDDGRVRLGELDSDERDELSELDVDGDGVLTRADLSEFVRRDAGGARFEVHGTRAVMTGDIGPLTPGRVLRLVLENPRVDTIVLKDVPGSLDDVANLRAARLVRRLGLSTHVPADGEVASGGTDFFLAGVRRTAAAGARFGVHSWGGLDGEGRDVPRDDPEHALYLEFYADVGISAEFYWFTLDAAGADDIHWMTREELARYGLLTEPSAPR